VDHPAPRRQVSAEDDRNRAEPPTPPAGRRQTSAAATGRGRTGRGQVRRAAIVEAAATLLLDGGVAAVTHRAVAAAAKVPLGSTTYYFGHHDDLVAAAVRRAGEREGDRARAAAGTRPRRRGTAALARHLVDVVVGADRLADPARVAGLYERIVEAARVPAARPGAQAWNEATLAAVADVLATYDVDVPAEAALAMVDGTVLSWLLSADPAPGGGPPGDVDLVAQLAANLRRLTGPRPG
jgi:DNA-binding transcriptional regulator YbjK